MTQPDVAFEIERFELVPLGARWGLLRLEMRWPHPIDAWPGTMVVTERGATDRLPAVSETGSDAADRCGAAYVIPLEFAGRAAARFALELPSREVLELPTPAMRHTKESVESKRVGPSHPAANRLAGVKRWMEDAVALEGLRAARAAAAERETELKLQLEEARAQLDLTADALGDASKRLGQRDAALAAAWEALESSREESVQARMALEDQLAAEREARSEAERRLAGEGATVVTETGSGHEATAVADLARRMGSLLPLGEALAVIAAGAALVVLGTTGSSSLRSAALVVLIAALISAIPLVVLHVRERRREGELSNTGEIPMPIARVEIQNAEGRGLLTTVTAVLALMVAAALFALLLFRSPTIGGPSAGPTRSLATPASPSTARPRRGRIPSPPTPHGGDQIVASALVKDTPPGSRDTIDNAASHRIRDSSVTHPASGLYCFNRLGFPPAQITVLPGQDNVTAENILGSAGSPCPAGAQVTVRLLRHGKPVDTSFTIDFQTQST